MDAEARRNRQRRPRYRSPGRDAPPPEPSAAPAEVQRGVVKWFNRGKGYGFISCQDGSEVFVHESAVILGNNDLALAKGREVEFELRQGPRGLQAYSVVVLGDAPEELPEEDREPAEVTEPVFDFSRRVPPSWQRKPNAFVYTYTIYGRRGSG